MVSDHEYANGVAASDEVEKEMIGEALKIHAAKTFRNRVALLRRFNGHSHASQELGEKCIAETRTSYLIVISEDRVYIPLDEAVIDQLHRRLAAITEATNSASEIPAPGSESSSALRLRASSIPSS